MDKFYVVVLIIILPVLAIKSVLCYSAKSWVYGP